MKRLVELCARVLALLWAGFWIYFFVAESLATGTPLRVSLLWVSVGLLFLLLAFVPWRWELMGGMLLAVLGVAAALGYAILAPQHLTVGVRALTAATFGVPPLLAGVLFLVHRRLALHSL